ncbi:AraC family transcriptional regulator [Shewanella sp. SR1]|uniref:AraC family transcriptional regulator n=1 Tax=Shewanella sp. SR1 TaxID=2855505 RepID=UPI001CF2A15B|nr:AraC family transcriptional regulator [Shewanella sp. SR1]MCB2382831.1 AraC family transcriptional regulator [Shewanella sp. SR1]
MYLVRSGAVGQFEQLVLELGENPIEIMQQAGLRQAQFRDPNTYIAYARLAELLEIAALRCRQPLFGILLAQRQTLHVLGDLPMLVSRTATVADALARVNQYLYLHASGVSLQRDPQGDYMRLALTLNVNSPRGLTQLIQMSVAQLAMFVSGLLNISVNSIILHLRQTKENDDDANRLVRLPPIRFYETFDGIVLKTSQLASRNHHDEDALNRHLQSHLQYLQSHYPDNLADQARDLIHRLLPTGECRIERVSAALGLHERTLQTKLKHGGQSYRQLLQEVRQNRAEQQLTYGVQTITEIALQLGYAEVAVFSRHFKSWTGRSPRQWQQQKKELQATKSPA